MTDVSIILACYNASRFVEAAVVSALSQDNPSLEILVVDDGSTDYTRSRVSRMAADDSRVRLIVGAGNQGPGFARNLAIAEAQGEWVGVLDADDAFAPERLSRLLSLGRESGADIVSDNLRLVEETSGQSVGVMFPPSWISEIRQLKIVDYIHGNIGRRGAGRRAYGFMKPLIRRSYLDKTGISYRVSRFSEDYILGLDLLLAGAWWVVTPEDFYLYSIRPDSLSAVCADEVLEAVLDAEHQLFQADPVQADGELSHALRLHHRSVLHALRWNQFVRHLKQRRPVSASRMLVSDPATASHLLRELSALGRRRMGWNEAGRSGQAP